MPAARKPRYKVAYRYALMNGDATITCTKTWPQRSLALKYRAANVLHAESVLVKVEIHVP
jgi:hypothetical protein